MLKLVRYLTAVLLLVWLGAVITNPRIIGSKETPVRAIVDWAAQLIPMERSAMSMVVGEDGLAGLFYGSPEASWEKAADLSRNADNCWW